MFKFKTELSVIYFVKSFSQSPISQHLIDLYH